MTDVINQYYEIEKQPKMHVQFHLTTNHPDSATYAIGTLTALDTGVIGERMGTLQPAALVSQEVNWYFLSHGYTQGDETSPKVEKVERLVLRLYPVQHASGDEGSLTNPNWKEPIPIKSLQAVEHGAKGHILYGLDANGAAVTIALKTVQEK